MTAHIARRRCIRLLNAVLAAALALAAFAHPSLPSLAQAQAQAHTINPRSVTPALRYALPSAAATTSVAAPPAQTPPEDEAEAVTVAEAEDDSSPLRGLVPVTDTVLTDPPVDAPIMIDPLAVTAVPNLTITLFVHPRAAVSNTVLTGTMTMVGGYDSRYTWVYLYLPAELAYIEKSASHTSSATSTSYTTTTHRLTFTYPKGYTATGQVITATWRMTLTAPLAPINLTITGTTSPFDCCTVLPAVLQVKALDDNPFSGNLVARLTHFSAYEVPWGPAEPQPWKLAAHGGQVSTFRGALTYAYPIQTPAAPGGVAPDLSIAYSSVAADSGVDESRSSFRGWSLGNGWSLGVPKITRLARTSAVEVFGPLQAQPGEWLRDMRGYLYARDGQLIVAPFGSTLLEAYCYGPATCDFQGWTYTTRSDYRNQFTLDLGGASYTLVPAGSSYTDYVTEPYTPLKVRRCNARSTPACPTDGWQDTSVDREWWEVRTTDGARYVLGGDAMGTRFIVGAGMGGVGGNVESYDPATVSDADYAGGQAGQLPAAWFVRKVYTPPASSGGIGRVGAEYHYTNTTNTNILLQAITYGPTVRPDGVPVSSGDFFTVTFGYAGASLTTIQVNTLSGRLRRYVLTYGADGLQRIDEQGLDDETGRLSAHFGYDSVDDRTLVTSIDNNYGVTWRYAYAPTAAGNAHVVVSATTTVEGLRQAPWEDDPELMYRTASTTEYVYGMPCYDRATDACRSEVGGGDAWAASYGLIGFAQVTETTHYDSHPAVQRTFHVFHVERPFTGREYETRALDGDLATQSRQATAYHAFTAAEIGATAAITFVAAVSTTTWPGGDAHPGYFKHTRTTYDPAIQGTVFQGLPTSVTEYDSTYATPYRRSVSAYAFDDAAWLSRPVSETLYDGVGNRLSERRYYYDGHPLGVLAGPGRLTFVQDLGREGDPAGERTRDVQLSYDALGNPTSTTTWADYGTPDVTHANGRTGATTYAWYDPLYGLFVTSVTNPLGHTEQYFYYGVNALPPLSPTTFYQERQPFGALQFVQGPNGPATGTRYYYDALGRLTEVVRPSDSFAAPSVRYRYYDANNDFVNSIGDYWDGQNSYYDAMARRWNGLKVSEYRKNVGGTGTNPSNNSQGYYYYDGLGRLVQSRVELAEGGEVQSVTMYDYDTAGRTLRAALPISQTGLAWGPYSYQPPDWGALEYTATAYDGLGRVVTVTHPDGTQVTTGYAGPDTVLTDALGRARVTRADVFGRLTRVVEPPGDVSQGSTAYSYDPQDHLTQVTDVLGNLTQLGYDAFGRKAQLVDPDMGTWQYAYDAAGNLTVQDDANGGRQCFYYDLLGRLKGKLAQPTSAACPADPGESGYAQHYYYDEGGAAAFAVGQRTHIANAADTTTWTYDARGRVVTETKQVAGVTMPLVMSYVYNGNDQVARVQYASRENVYVHYNPAWQPDKVFNNNELPLQVYARDVLYNPLGQVAQMRAGNGLTTTFSYYPYYPGHHRLQRLWVANGLLDLAYGYDAVGNVTALTDTVGATSLSATTRWTG